MNWLRENKYAAILLTIVRLYVGWQWLTAGWGKITAAKPFDASGFVKGAIAKPIMESGSNELVYSNYVSFLKNFALPNIKIFNLIVPWGEFLVGLGLIIGCLTTAAALFGIMMNFSYLFAGSISINPWMALLGFIILAAGVNAGKLGVDYVLAPKLRSLFSQRLQKTRGRMKESAR
ncbi:DoxX family protein [Paenibacillus sp. sptzw28]|uniref:DoxX family protein n=1 Tax=Paenibacillus sp. sptzw28 TaxID=715179 RepID=UPI001C6EB783|nr:DoxX family protein [Paenibacillus sp. sptzw28]QYR21602.1 DoxX family protein [Paenibacillus sp. sptzw28]